MDWLIILTFVVSIGMGAVSGMGGGGAGFVVIPYYIFIGLTPQQAVATGKMGSLGMAAGAVTAFRGKGLVNKKYLLYFLAITTVCALISAWLLPQIDNKIFQQIIGWVLIVLSPTLFIKKAAFQPGERSRGWIIAGFIAYTFISFGQTLLGTGIGTLLILVLMFLFGLNSLQANATKRVAQLSQALILFVLLMVQGLVVFGHGLAALLGSWIGGHIGTNFAIKRGTEFVKVMLAVLMAVSGVVLLIL
jgi:hypothetical protein